MFSLKMFVNVMTKKTPDDKSIKTKNIKITEKNGRENYYRKIQCYDKKMEPLDKYFDLFVVI